MKYHLDFDIDFKRNSGKGLYVAIEGIDGSGKTTQVERLTKHFKNLGKEVVMTREPRKKEGVIGRFVQEILLGNIKVPSVALQYLFTADRVMHHDELIVPSLKKGKIVVSDRSFWSAVPYGVMDRGEKLSKNSADNILVSQSILSMYNQFTIPDFTFYLDIPLNKSLDRLSKKVGEAKEIYEERSKILKAKEGYDWLLKEFPKEFVVIDGTQPVDEVNKEIISKISLELKGRK